MVSRNSSTGFSWDNSHICFKPYLHHLQRREWLQHICSLSLISWVLLGLCLLPSMDWLEPSALKEMPSSLKKYMTMSPTLGNGSPGSNVTINKTVNVVNLVIIVGIITIRSITQTTRILTATKY